MSDDMETVPPRVNELEKITHTHDHRITQLEKLPPRVGELEQSIGVMNAHLTHIQKTSGEIKTSMENLSKQHEVTSGQIAGFMKAVKVIGGLVTLAGVGTAVVLFVMG